MTRDTVFMPPGVYPLLHQTRVYTAFDLPPAFDRVKFDLRVSGQPNGVVTLLSDATGPSRTKEPLIQTGRRIVEVMNGRDAQVPGPWSQASLELCGDTEAMHLFASFFRGQMALGWIADWVEDDAADRVRRVRHHWIDAHRLHPDPVYHFLGLMRCYRDGRKKKATAY